MVSIQEASFQLLWLHHTYYSTPKCFIESIMFCISTYIRNTEADSALSTVLAAVNFVKTGRNYPLNNTFILLELFPTYSNNTELIESVETNYTFFNCLLRSDSSYFSFFPSKRATLMESQFNDQTNITELEFIYLMLFAVNIDREVDFDLLFGAALALYFVNHNINLDQKILNKYSINLSRNNEFYENFNRAFSTFSDFTKRNFVKLQKILFNGEIKIKNEIDIKAFKLHPEIDFEKLAKKTENLNSLLKSLSQPKPVGRKPRKPRTKTKEVVNKPNKRKAVTTTKATSSRKQDTETNLKRSSLSSDPIRFHERKKPFTENVTEVSEFDSTTLNTRNSSPPINADKIKIPIYNKPIIKQTMRNKPKVKAVKLSKPKELKSKSKKNTTKPLISISSSSESSDKTINKSFKSKSKLNNQENVNPTNKTLEKISKRLITPCKGSVFQPEFQKCNAKPSIGNASSISSLSSISDISNKSPPINKTLGNLKNQENDKNSSKDVNVALKNKSFEKSTKPVEINSKKILSSDKNQNIDVNKKLVNSKEKHKDLDHQSTIKKVFGFSMSSSDSSLSSESGIKNTQEINKIPSTDINAKSKNLQKDTAVSKNSFTGNIQPNTLPANHSPENSKVQSKVNRLSDSSDESYKKSFSEKIQPNTLPVNRSPENSKVQSKVNRLSDSSDESYKESFSEKIQPNTLPVNRSPENSKGQPKVNRLSDSSDESYKKSFSENIQPNTLSANRSSDHSKVQSKVDRLSNSSDESYKKSFSEKIQPNTLPANRSPENSEVQPKVDRLSDSSDRSCNKSIDGSSLPNTALVDQTVQISKVSGSCQKPLDKEKKNYSESSGSSTTSTESSFSSIVSTSLTESSDGSGRKSFSENTQPNTLPVNRSPEHLKVQSKVDTLSDSSDGSCNKSIDGISLLNTALAPKNKISGPLNDQSNLSDDSYEKSFSGNIQPNTVSVEPFSTLTKSPKSSSDLSHTEDGKNVCSKLIKSPKDFSTTPIQLTETHESVTKDIVVSSSDNKPSDSNEISKLNYKGVFGDISESSSDSSEEFSSPSPVKCNQLTDIKSKRNSRFNSKSSKSPKSKQIISKAYFEDLLRKLSNNDDESANPNELSDSGLIVGELSESEESSSPSPVKCNEVTDIKSERSDSFNSKSNKSPTNKIDIKSPARRSETKAAKSSDNKCSDSNELSKLTSEDIFGDISESSSDRSEESSSPSPVKCNEVTDIKSERSDSFNSKSNKSPTNKKVIKSPERRSDTKEISISVNKPSDSNELSKLSYKDVLGDISESSSDSSEESARPSPVKSTNIKSKRSSSFNSQSSKRSTSKKSIKSKSSRLPTNKSPARRSDIKEISSSANKSSDSNELSKLTYKDILGDISESSSDSSEESSRLSPVKCNQSTNIKSKRSSSFSSKSRKSPNLSSIKVPSNTDLQYSVPLIPLNFKDVTKKKSNLNVEPKKSSKKQSETVLSSSIPVETGLINKTPTDVNRTNIAKPKVAVNESLVKDIDCSISESMNKPATLVNRKRKIKSQLDVHENLIKKFDSTKSQVIDETPCVATKKRKTDSKISPVHTESMDSKHPESRDKTQISSAVCGEVDSKTEMNKLIPENDSTNTQEISERQQEIQRRIFNAKMLSESFRVKISSEQLRKSPEISAQELFRGMKIPKLKPKDLPHINEQSKDKLLTNEKSPIKDNFNSKKKSYDTNLRNRPQSVVENITTQCLDRNDDLKSTIKPSFTCNKTNSRINTIEKFKYPAKISYIPYQAEYSFTDIPRHICRCKTPIKAHSSSGSDSSGWPADGYSDSDEQKKFHFPRRSFSNEQRQNFKKTSLSHSSVKTENDRKDRIYRSPSPNRRECDFRNRDYKRERYNRDSKYSRKEGDYRTMDNRGRNDRDFKYNRKERYSRSPDYKRRKVDYRVPCNRRETNFRNSDYNRRERENRSPGYNRKERYSRSPGYNRRERENRSPGYNKKERYSRSPDYKRRKVDYRVPDNRRETNFRNSDYNRRERDNRVPYNDRDSKYKRKERDYRNPDNNRDKYYRDKENNKERNYKSSYLNERDQMNRKRRYSKSPVKNIENSKNISSTTSKNKKRNLSDSSRRNNQKLIDNDNPACSRKRKASRSNSVSPRKSKAAKMDPDVPNNDEATNINDNLQKEMCLQNFDESTCKGNITKDTSPNDNNS